LRPSPARPHTQRVAGNRPWFNDDLADRSGERMPPADDAPALDWLLFDQNQVVTWRQAVAHIGEGRLRHLLARGSWQRTRYGVFVAHSGPLTRSQQLWVAVLGSGSHAVLAGLTAAHEGGLNRAPGPLIHVLVPAKTRPNQPGRSVRSSAGDMPTVVAHRTTRLPDKDVLHVARPPRTFMPRSLVDAAQWATSDDEARAIVAAGCQQRLVRPEEVLEVVDRMPRARRRGVVVETVGFATAGAEAVSEINFDRLCRAFGLPVPDKQVRRRDRSGRQRYIDAHWRAYGVWAEIDGGWHVDPAASWGDMWRQNDLWIDGEIVLRFPAWAIMRQPESVASQLSRALQAGGWRPSRDLG